MAASRVQFANSNNAAGGNYPVTLPAGTSNGNLLVVCVGGFDPLYGNFVDLPDLSDNLGTQYQIGADVQVANDRLTIFYVPGVAAGAKTLNIYQSFPSTAVAIEYTGLLNQVDVIGSFLTQTDPSGTVTWTSSTIVPSGSGLILGFAIAVTMSGAVFAAGTGYTLVVEQDDATNGSSSAVFEKLNAASLTPYNVNGTTGSATRVDTVSMCFK